MAFYKTWTPLMEHLKLAEQDDISPPFSINFSNMQAGGSVRIAPRALADVGSTSSASPMSVSVSAPLSLAPKTAKVLGG